MVFCSFSLFLSLFININTLFSPGNTCDIYNCSTNAIDVCHQFTGRVRAHDFIHHSDQLLTNGYDVAISIEFTESISGLQVVPWWWNGGTLYPPKFYPNGAYRSINYEFTPTPELGWDPKALQNVEWNFYVYEVSAFYRITTYTMQVQYISILVYIYTYICNLR